MENILHDFNEKVINLVTNYLKNSISDGGLSNFTDDLVKEFADLGKEDIIKRKKQKKEYICWTNFCN